MEPLGARVAARYLQAARLTLGPGKVNQEFTEQLSKMPLRAKTNGSFHEGVLSAGHYAKKLKQTMFLYSGNSFGHSIWRVSQKPADYLDPINNTGTRVLSVTPELVVSWHDVKRPG